MAYNKNNQGGIAPKKKRVKPKKTGKMRTKK